MTDARPPASSPTADILERFRIGPDTLLGAGGQSEVFALDAARVLRVYREPRPLPELRDLQTFLAAIDGRMPLATPSIQDIDPDGRYTVQRRLTGTDMLRLLPTLSGERRQAAIRNFVMAAETITTVALPDLPYGHVLGPDAIHADTWAGFLRASLDRAIARNGIAIAAEVGDVANLRARALELLAAVPETPSKALVHGDYFPGNVMMDDALAVTGIVDFSRYTLVGGPRYDVLTAPIFLEMIEEATAEDVALAHAASEARQPTATGIARFYRAHAAFWMADPAYALPPYPRIYPWAIANLKALATT